MSESQNPNDYFKNLNINELQRIAREEWSKFAEGNIRKVTLFRHKSILEERTKTKIKVPTKYVVVLESSLAGRKIIIGELINQVSPQGTEEALYNNSLWGDLVHATECLSTGVEQYPGNKPSLYKESFPNDVYIKQPPKFWESEWRFEPLGHGDKLPASIQPDTKVVLFDPDDWSAWSALKSKIKEECSRENTEQKNILILKKFLKALSPDTSHYEGISREVVEKINELTHKPKDDNRALENEKRYGARSLEDLIPILKKADEEITAIRARAASGIYNEKKLKLARDCFDKNDFKYVQYVDINQDWFHESDGVKYARYKVYKNAALTIGIKISVKSAIDILNAFNNKESLPEVKWSKCTPIKI